MESRSKASHPCGAHISQIFNYVTKQEKGALIFLKIKKPVTIDSSKDFFIWTPLYTRGMGGNVEGYIACPCLLDKKWRELLYANRGLSQIYKYVTKQEKGGPSFS